MEIKLLFSSKGDKRIIIVSLRLIANYDTDKNVIARTEGNTRHWLERYHFVVNTLNLGLKMNLVEVVKGLAARAVRTCSWQLQFLRPCKSFQYLRPCKSHQL